MKQKYYSITSRALFFRAFCEGKYLKLLVTVLGGKHSRKSECDRAQHNLLEVLGLAGDLTNLANRKKLKSFVQKAKNHKYIM